MSSIGIIGAGLAGCEAALALARRGIAITLYEMRPANMTPAHTTGLPAELVCSNSLKSTELPGAQALLKEELSLLSSPLLSCAKKCAIPAGKALAVDRKAFSAAVLSELRGASGITLEMREIAEPPQRHDAVIIATGPLSSEAIVSWLTAAVSRESLHFYDAIAPIVAAESVDLSKAFFGSRWRPSEKDYCNCPFTEEEYDAFLGAIATAETAAKHPFEEEKYFEACLPLDIVAKRGRLAMAYGPLKPVGIDDPKTGKRPFAVCQLRREDAAGASFGLVACQSRLRQGEQQRIFRMIPGLEHAEFLRWGSCHRNTYVDSPELLNPNLSLKKMPSIFLGGQLCGSEGYMESIATGMLAALFAAAAVSGRSIDLPPETTALGGLLRHVTGSTVRPFSPSSFHFGLLPPLEPAGRKARKQERHMRLCERSLTDIKKWLTDDMRELR
ncbi:MAG TPA: methylenetetrahydrofolate--tRNA-(uracil(54)-C(5))-methyltransferase (FADH(2)-oxidizing) TrmFO [Chitinivibrionales bacterium]|jgi:methylenetetrahydrofolate--tRNA-(uracil-5-)-methyltransferase|nr:methylenetetrahydrofolate--tRNA-(uracil(54)-C(5))-methyltransferase (FADH(2)-oxidizing) TrmFO [Chitinivibrionales bacterium]